MDSIMTVLSLGLAVFVIWLLVAKRNKKNTPPPGGWHGGGDDGDDDAEGPDKPL